MKNTDYRTLLPGRRTTTTIGGIRTPAALKEADDATVELAEAFVAHDPDILEWIASCIEGDAREYPPEPLIGVTATFLEARFPVGDHSGDYLPFTIAALGRIIELVQGRDGFDGRAVIDRLIEAAEL